MPTTKFPTRYLFASTILLSSALLAPSSAFAQTSTSSDADPEEVFELSPFEVQAESSVGYTATQTLAGSRINTRLEDVGSAISVVTAEFMQDTGATDNKSLLAYTTNTEVAGPQGNFTGASGGQVESEAYRLTNPNSTTRVRGLTAADNTRNFFGSSIPWDGYAVDRIDVQRGPNSILFGLGSPAGIINATMKTAVHDDFGSVELRVGSYGSNRQSLDVNRNLIDDELSVRFIVLRNDEQYRQDPAYSLDKRIFGTVRYEPKFLRGDGAKTTFKSYFEGGTIRSNNPRRITPLDQITGWWDQLDQATYDPASARYSGQFYTYDAQGNESSYYPPNMGQFNNTRDGGVANPTFEPWLNDVGMYGGVWLQYNNGQNQPFLASMPEFKTIGGRSSTGEVDNTVALPFSRRVLVSTTTTWATRANAEWANKGLWKSDTLSDPSVFDFYNNLIDGDTKQEWQNFNNVNFSLNQTFWDHRIGIEAAYDRQKYSSGSSRISPSGALTVDINTTNLDGTPNQNLGRPYIYGTGTGGRSDITNESWRVNAYGSYDFSKEHEGWLMRLLGRHMISGLVSQDARTSDSRNFMVYGTPDEFGNLVATGTAATFIDSNDRVVIPTIYLGDSLLGANSYRGVNIPRPGGIDVPRTVDWYYFDATWNAGPSVAFDADYYNYFTGRLSTQSENPDNYVGWRSRQVEILNAYDGDQDALTTSANLQKREVNSYAAVWQANLWNDSIVGMWGIRYDEVDTYGRDASRVNNRAQFDGPDGRLYTLNGISPIVDDAYSPSWSVVAKLNNLVGNRLPIDVNLAYNRSENFQVTGPRNDILGNALAAPSGETEDYGIVLADKSRRFIFRINRFETKALNANNSVGFPTWFFTGTGNFIMRNEDRVDAYEYQLGELGNPGSAGQDGSWEWQYAPRVGETQEQADAEMNAAIAAWRQYTQEPLVQQIMQAWGFNDFGVTQLTTMSTPVNNFTATEDQISKGWEYEFTGNPTRNWRITFNASETEAIRSNIGGQLLSNFVELTNEYQNGPMGQIRQWGGGGISSTSLVSWNSNFYSSYVLMKQMEGQRATDLRRWRFNLVTNYEFDEGPLEGINIGAGYRWQDKVVIGYRPELAADGQSVIFDLDSPYYGPSEDAIDLWIGYKRKLTDKIDWRIQLNVRNVGQHEELIPVATQWDGTVAQWAIAPHETWTLSTTFEF
ncbi:MAG: TonB-dependent receptor plug domain-containing protein [Verrucomicrobiota bacterium JB022]|nr:TonB-dependent receptor plug domain-containing protein [Verrucomicrobiota bacterium JB022]